MEIIFDKSIKASEVTHEPRYIFISDAQNFSKLASVEAFKLSSGLDDISSQLRKLHQHDQVKTAGDELFVITDSIQTINACIKAIKILETTFDIKFRTVITHQNLYCRKGIHHGVGIVEAARLLPLVTPNKIWISSDVYDHYILDGQNIHNKYSLLGEVIIYRMESRKVKIYESNNGEASDLSIININKDSGIRLKRRLSVSVIVVLSLLLIWFMWEKSNIEDELVYAITSHRKEIEEIKIKANNIFRENYTKVLIAKELYCESPLSTDEAISVDVIVNEKMVTRSETFNAKKGQVNFIHDMEVGMPINASLNVRINYGNKFIEDVAPTEFGPNAVVAKYSSLVNTIRYIFRYEIVNVAEHQLLLREQ